ncbi:nucleic acid-binding protein [Nostoc punctiforme NIES-2108]|uniref:Nucleic acid-binding protein n=1 Tax=Nostoc punctiforme NIES-2108 TaxID=1356359 RepID=A0A367RB35_NOSPU|nr:nucleic acid-binding protein [Nostoc punctiforme NIES-2108]
MIVVSDTTPLSELSKIGKLDLLSAVFGRVIIPQQVYTELTTGNHPAVLVVKSALWLEVLSISNNQLIEQLQLETNLDLGECSAIILAEELKADQLLIDEKAGRKVAISRGLPIIGLVGVIILAKEQGLIDNVKNILDDLMSKGTRISPKIYDYALITAREI